MIYPQLNPELMPPADLDIDLHLLWRSLCAELLDRNFMGRTHNNKRTYDAGCRGPLCCKAGREINRSRTGNTASQYYRYYEAIIAYWYPEAVKQTDALYQNLIESI